MSPSRQSFNETLLFQSPRFEVEEATILRAAYGALAEGKRVSAADLARRADVPVEAITRYFARWPSGVIMGADGRIDGCFGLSVTPTPHLFEIGRRRLYTWCAWDGLFIPRVVGKTARLSSACPVSGEAIVLLVAPNGVLDADPDTAVMSFLASFDPAGNGTGACCRYIHFFASAEATRRWQAGHPTGCVLTMQQAWSLARTFVDTKVLAAGTAASPEQDYGRAPNEQSIADLGKYGVG